MLAHAEHVLTFFSACSACFNSDTSSSEASSNSDDSNKLSTIRMTNFRCFDIEPLSFWPSKKLKSKSWSCLHYEGLAASGCVCSTPQRHVLHIDVSKLQRPVLHLDVSTPQRPELHLAQRHVLHIDERVYTTKACAAPGHDYTTEAAL